MRCNRLLNDECIKPLDEVNILAKNIQYLDKKYFHRKNPVKTDRKRALIDMLSPRYQLKREQFIPCAVTDVFAFFADTGNLERITPAFLHFRIETPLPITMEAGALIAYRLRLFGMPFRWLTRIELFQQQQRFVDRQIHGPYRLWHHLHEFTVLEGGTLMRDIVDYELPCGRLGTLMHALWVQRMLDRIFDYRRDQIARIFS